MDQNKKQANLMNLDLPKTNFLGIQPTIFINEQGEEVEKDVVKIKYAENQHFSVLASSFHKLKVNDKQEVSADGKVHSSKWVEQDASPIDYDFIRISLNSEKDIRISIKTTEFNSVTGKPKWENNPISFNLLCKHFAKERDKVAEIKKNPIPSREKSQSYSQNSQQKEQSSENQGITFDGDDAILWD